MNGFDSVEEALEELRNGKIILVTDDPDRENEGDFISPYAMYFLIQYIFLLLRGQNHSYWLLIWFVSGR